MIALSQVSRSFTVGDQQVAALRGIDLNIAAGDYVSYAVTLKIFQREWLEIINQFGRKKP